MDFRKAREFPMSCSCFNHKFWISESDLHFRFDAYVLLAVVINRQQLFDVKYLSTDFYQ